ncbi:MAG: hypothetical protein EBS05_13210 [Proteobacteria bacterium]|nr:hypothetical protein [Pseudomonadota bacterium]
MQSTTATVDGSPANCLVNYTLAATMKLALETRSDSSAAGTADASVTLGTVSSTCSLLPSDIGSGTATFTGPITGTTGALRFSQEITQNQSFPGVSVISKITLTFTGSLSSGVVTGTITMAQATNVDGQGITGRGVGTGTYAITLR